MSLAGLLRDYIHKLFSETLNQNETISALLTSMVMIATWLLIAKLAMMIVKIFSKNLKKIEGAETKQALTIRRLVNNLFRAIFILWISIMILGEIGIDLVPLFAGAGIAAFAIGFGAQELIKDVINGFFLIVEKTFTIEDQVEINEHKGVITDIGLRRTKILNWRGEVITINNGDIKTVINFSVNPSLAVIDFKVSATFDVTIFEQEEFKEFLKGFATNQPEVIEEPTGMVITSITEDAITCRITLKTNNRKHVGVEREFRKEIIKYLDSKGLSLEIPFVITHNS